VTKAVEEREQVIVKFAGDSGDGMQLAGSRFTDATAVLGNDLATMPSFPAEIRAPAGTLAGVSAFQIHFASRDILTPGDAPNVLVAMNPAALKANREGLPRGATIIVNEDAFSKRNLEKAGYTAHPLEDGSLSEYRVHRIPMTTLTTRAVEGIEDASTRDAGRAKNLFALGVLSWLYGRPVDVTLDWLQAKFAKRPAALKANLAAFNAGWSFGETTELLEVQYRVNPATDVPPGVYRNVNGTQSLALGLIAASVKSGLPLVLASYPITPASEILHELSKHTKLGISTVQAEDEIAAAGMALGAAFGGRLGVTATSGPGMDLKAEAIGLAVMLELPMIIIDVQRAGPSTGMPTKTEQADLLMALHGRQHAGRLLPGRVRRGLDCGPLPHAGDPALRRLPGELVGAVADPGCRLAARDRSGVCHQRRPRRAVPPLQPGRQARASVGHPRHAGPGASDRRHREGRRDGEHLLRRPQPRADDRAASGEDRRHRRRDPGADGRRRPGRDALGARLGLQRRRDGLSVARAHLRHLNPWPSNLGDVLRSFDRVLVPEMNTGQLAQLLRAKFLIDVESFTKVQGQPLFAAEIKEQIEERAGR
jgi:2-oxoglutarate ferredoxin oxidoreductase subunit alpha